MKKLISIVLILSCLLTLLPMTASASKGGKLIALTFDDGPGAYTNRLLDGLAERGVKVTFFMQGKNAVNYRETVRRVYSEGHQIASHTYNHPTLSTQSTDEVLWQLNRTDEILDGHLGRDFKYLLRPPYGDYSTYTLSIIRTPAIIWSVDPLDWKYRNAYTVRDNIVSAAFDGAIVLAHDIHSTTVDGALMAIDSLLAQGYEFVTVNELFRRRGVTLTDGSLYYSCKPNGTDLGEVTMPAISVTAIYGGYQVKLTADSGAEIYYTTDGSDPVFNGAKYAGEFQVVAGQTVKAVAAYNLNGSRSEVLEQCMTGVQVVEAEVEVKDGCVVFKNPNVGTELRYTTDGSTPTQYSAVYSDPIACYDGALGYRVMGEGIGSQAKMIYVTKNGNLFWDVSNTKWYFGTVDLAVKYGLFNGTGRYRFEPEESLTRAMFVTVLARLMEKQGKEVAPKGTAVFTDVQAGRYYTNAVAWAAENGIVMGYGDNTFHPDAEISREEMCVILDRALTWLGETPTGSGTAFADGNSISGWAKNGVAHMSAMGIILGQGNNCFAPKSTATRAEAATVLLRVYDLVTK